MADITNRVRCGMFGDGIVTDQCGCEVSPLDDDYEYYKSELDNMTNPLSDDYCKYDNE